MWFLTGLKLQNKPVSDSNVLPSISSKVGFRAKGERTFHTVALYLWMTATFSQSNLILQTGSQLPVTAQPLILFYPVLGFLLFRYPSLLCCLFSCFFVTWAQRPTRFAIPVFGKQCGVGWGAAENIWVWTPILCLPKGLKWPQIKVWVWIVVFLDTRPCDQLVKYPVCTALAWIGSSPFMWPWKSLSRRR